MLFAVEEKNIVAILLYHQTKTLSNFSFQNSDLFTWQI